MNTATTAQKKTKAEILEGKYTVIDNGKEYAFNIGTPARLAALLIRLRNDQKRIVINYGDTNTGESWNETHDVTGYVGASHGFYALLWPLLVFNARSHGGTHILTAHILEIREAKGKKLIYSHDNNLI
jgi:hypothetical protein